MRSVHDGWSWFDLAWPWLGLGPAVMLLALLLGTDRFRGDLSVDRWRDLTWLGWLAVPVYLVHHIEEYGVDATGETHAFPDALCAQLGLEAYPACDIPEPFFAVVNCSAFWVAAPLAAWLGGRLPLVGMAFWGVIAANGVVHLVPLVQGDGYAAGTLTGALLFLPLAAWVASAAFLRGPLPTAGLLPVLAGGVLVHLVLLGSLVLHREGHLGDVALCLLQVVNAAVPLAVCALANGRLTRRRQGALRT